MSRDVISFMETLYLFLCFNMIMVAWLLAGRSRDKEVQRKDARRGKKV
jgi:hypothetical protein